MPQPTSEPYQIDPQVTSRLIAYIGNKRAILPFIARTVRLLRDGHGSGLPTFIDPFCGTGAVSRLARSIGFRVMANDWELYSRIVTAASIGFAPSQVDQLFREFGGLPVLLDHLNRLDGPPIDPYLSRYYAPRETERPIIGAERLFYTAENAVKIDRIREEIDTICPPDGSRAAEGRRTILLASLIYEAATHANTSGVFKAYHNGYGGHGRDALRRILAPIELETPPMPAGPVGTADCRDAVVFLGAASGDVCYLDPPYSGHQYGSNYFMLNTIALWDKPPVDNARDSDGRLLSKAGIRPDWTRTRSDFCSKRRATEAIREAVDAVDCRHLIMSYSSDGIVKLEELADLLASAGALTVETSGHTTYRGGRQSNARLDANSEFLFVVDRSMPPGKHGIERALAEARVRRLLGRTLDPAAVRREFDVDGALVRLTDGWKVETELLVRFLSPVVVPGSLGSGALNDVACRLELSVCPDRESELRVLLAARPATRQLLRRAISVLRKLAHPKYAEAFRRGLVEARAAVAACDGASGRTQMELDRLEGQFDERMKQRAAR